MSGQGPIDQTNLDEALLKICTPQDGIIDLVQLEEILMKGANPNSLHPWPAFTRGYAEEQSRFPLLQRIATAKNASEAAGILLKNGVDLTIVDPHTGNTVLHTAIAVKNEAYTLFLIERITNSDDQNIKKLIDQKDTKHPDWLNSPLILAFKKGLEDTVKALIASGADVSIADRDGTLPLHWAALLRYDEVIQALLQRGANPHTPTRFNHTAMELYEYEFQPLDFRQQLEYHEATKHGTVSFLTNLPELSDNRFHGVHRRKQQPDPHICQLLATKPHSILLNEQYIQNFITQDAIARSATCVLEYEYELDILPVLRSEGERFYGTKNKLPAYAGGGFFSKRSNPPNFDKTRKQIVDAMHAFKAPDETSQKYIEPDLTAWAYSLWELKVNNGKAKTADDYQGFTLLVDMDTHEEMIHQIYKYLKEGNISEFINFLMPLGKTANEIAQFIRKETNLEAKKPKM